ncbi:MAG TPA: dehydrogenase [Cyanobacteria bacterium UBA8803]|nr:dehydrogenase [Cyanobacteria bacterium UBA9273]HBL58055.1 dehydrogenase [Cyanobacteria bacterium UBA8803]
MANCVLSFNKDVSLIEEATDQVVVQSPFGRNNSSYHNLTVEQVSPGFLAVMSILAAKGATEEDLSNLVLQTDGVSQLPNFYYYLQKFTNLGLICHTVLDDGLPLAIRIPLSPADNLELLEAAIDQKFMLSRFAYCHQDRGQLILESPLSQAKIILTNWKGAALIAELAKPQSASEISSQLSGISAESIQLFFSLLLSANMLDKTPEGDKSQEVESDTLAQWEFHDLLFHARSRRGRHNNSVGKTFRFLGQIEQPPIVKPKMSDDIIELYRPDIERLKAEDCPFTRVLEERKSVRHYHDEPITDRQLGEFLYRSARVKRIFTTNSGELTNRPYPNGGSRYELELYVVVNTCDRIPSGLYHYDPQDHQLCRLKAQSHHIAPLLEEAYLATGKASRPQILIILAARFPRVAWVYESIAYSLILKGVGCLQQTMYLVATAMNLAPCAIGCGNADLFATAVGTDYYAESSVGEFILGSQPSP